MPTKEVEIGCIKAQDKGYFGPCLECPFPECLEIEDNSPDISKGLNLNQQVEYANRNKKQKQGGYNPVSRRVLIEHKNDIVKDLKTMSVSDVAKKWGISQGALSRNKQKWDLENKNIEKTIEFTGLIINFNGKSYKISGELTITDN